MPLVRCGSVFGATGERDSLVDGTRGAGQRYASFDIFDTALTRAVGEPTSAFLLLGRRLVQLGLLECSAEAFARARVESEMRARRNSAQLEVTLEQIYRELLVSLRMDRSMAGDLMRRELEIEAELLLPLELGRQRIAAARALGHSIVFLSDMYLPCDFVRGRLLEHGLWQAGDGCYMSCEHLASKASGNLFRLFMSEVGTRGDQVTHSGNDAFTDVAAARQVGLETVFCPEANLNRFEKILESHTFATEGLASVLAGASRAARLAVDARTSREVALRDVAAGVVAPLLTGFVLWVLGEARRRGLKRLYFVSRDGQILVEIARRLISKLDLSCDIRYLYGSRQAWHLASVSALGPRELQWIFDPTAFLSVSSLLARVEIAPSEVADILRQLGLAESDWNRNLNAAERRRVQDMVAAGDIDELVLRRAAAAQQMVVDYLRQEGLAAGDDWGLVDVGWRGRMQDSLSSILGTMAARAPTGLYFGLTRDSNETAGRDDKHAYMFDQRSDMGFTERVHDFMYSMEIFCAADHGLVVGYQRRGETIVPRLKQEHNRLALDWGLRIVHNTVCEFVDGLLLRADLVNPWADVRGATAASFDAFFQHPTPDEALAWGSFPAETDQNAVYQDPFARAYRWQVLSEVLREGRVLPRENLWPAGSWKLTPSALRGAIAVTQSLRLAVRRVVRGVRFHLRRAISR